MCLNGTHLARSNIELYGYTWFGHNRAAHRKAVKASGGVGMFVINSVLDIFCVNIVDESSDGILGLRFENRTTQQCFVIICCYLSPETSTWGRNADYFL